MKHKQALMREIARARDGRGYRSWGAKVGLSPATVWRYESGATVPCRAAEIDALANAGVDRQLLYAAANEAGCLVIAAEAFA